MIRLLWVALLAIGLTVEASAQDAAAVQTPSNARTRSALDAGDLRLAIERGPEGIRVTSLLDAANSIELLPANPDPLFMLVLREVASGKEIRLDAASGWMETEVVTLASPTRLRLRWQQARDPQLNGIRVIAEAIADAAIHAIRWQLQVENDSAGWSVWRVDYPRLAVGDLGPDAEVFIPRGPGEVQRALWQRAFQFRDTYPGAWMTMQFMAAYDSSRKTGVYVALHDPLGNTKDLAVESRPEEKAVAFLFEQPVENMGKAGNCFEGGEAVWRVLRGDWFDAAVFYRDWVRARAMWYPSRNDGAIAESASAMREIDAWAVGGGDPWVPGGSPSAERVAEIEQFAGALGVPVGMHWYRWHPNPFDNDYPHYLPAKAGFKEAVAQLQSNGVSVMPYINGRLWDTRDRGVEDFEFSRVARPYAAKDEKGEVIIEQYGSKEDDGSPVRFAVMCPATKFWQDRVHEITLRLYTDYGVKGVYIDQIAAAAARLCFDPSHGHPLGGGHWWADGYRQVLDRIRQDMPRDRFLTTECNAEAYVRWFDGYLTWHWQYDGQVPAFPTVYSGALAMFGRSYAGGPTRDLALRMKAGQQLVFGEQIGWINPSVISEAQNLAFLRHVARLRHRIGRYFRAGEMARPPRLPKNLPVVKADWGWGGGNWWVTTSTILSGAWRLPEENSVVLLFVNVGDEPVSTTVPIDAGEYGLATAQVQVTEIGEDGPVAQHVAARTFEHQLTIPPRTALAYKIDAI
jgi:hypothetical protein